MGHRFNDLRTMSDDELIVAHDRLASNTSVGISYYLDELARRETTRSAARVARMTETVRRLTWVIAGLTAVSLVAAIVAAVAAVRLPNG